MDKQKLKIYYSSFFILIFSSAILFSQNKVSLGLRDEVGVTNIKIGNTRKTDLFIIPIQNLYLTVDFNINDNNSFQIRPGYIIVKNNFEGWEFGGYWIYNFPNINFFSSLGFNYHFNNDNTGGNSGGSGNPISLLGIGFGYKTSDLISLEISYHHPLKRNYGLFFYKRTHYEHYLTKIIKFGISIQIL